MINQLLFDIADQPTVDPYIPSSGLSVWIVIGVGVVLLAVVIFLIVKLAKKK